MSVIFFSADELGNLAAAYSRARRIRLSPQAAEQDIREICDLLAKVSISNATAWEDRYGKAKGDAGKAATSDQIFFCALRKYRGGVCSTATAIGTLTMLQYNCDDETLCGYHEGLLRMACTFLRGTQTEER